MNRREFLDRMMAAGLVAFTPTVFPVKLWEPPKGRYIELVHQFDLPSGVGMRSENSFLPNSGQSLFVITAQRLLDETGGRFREEYDRYRRVWGG